MTECVNKAFAAGSVDKSKLEALKAPLAAMLERSAHSLTEPALTRRTPALGSLQTSLVSKPLFTLTLAPSPAPHTAGRREAERCSKRRVIQANKYISDACVLSVIGSGWQARPRTSSLGCCHLRRRLRRRRSSTLLKLISVSALPRDPVRGPVRR